MGVFNGKKAAFYHIELEELPKVVRNKTSINQITQN